MTTTTEDLVLTVTDVAIDVIRDMSDQVTLAMNCHAHDRAEVLKMSESLHRGLAQIINTGFGRKTRIMRDGPLSLYVQTESGFTMGMIFHPVRADFGDESDPKIIPGSSAKHEGRYCVRRLENNTWCGKPVMNHEPTCTGHGPVIMLAPSLGTWSLHS